MEEAPLIPPQRTVGDEQEPHRRSPTRVLLAAVFITGWVGVILGVAGDREIFGNSSGKLVLPSTKLDTSGFKPVGKASDWQMYKVTLSVIPGTGNETANFFTEFVAPAVVDLPTDLGCSSKRYAVTLMNQDLHWVDAKLMEREGKGTTFWNDYFKDMNKDMTEFNAFMHNKVMLYVPSLEAHSQKLKKAGKQDLFMERLSKDGDGESVAHLTINVQGRLYELVAPAEGLDTSTFSDWSEEECASVQVVPETLKAMREKYEELKAYHDENSADDKVANFDLPVPMVVHHSIATDDFSKQNDLAHLVKFTGAIVADSVEHSDTCSSLTLSWDYENEGADVFKLPSVTYVINTGASTGEYSVSDYLDYLWDDEHVKFAGDYKKHWGDNWDHWLDYHIGMQVTNFSTSTVGGTGGEVSGYHDLIYNTLHELSWPVGYRHGLQTGEPGNDYHFYTGYRNTYAWEWLIDDGKSKGHVYDLCGCLPENNAKIYFDEVGTGKEESQCGWAEGTTGYNSN